MGDPGRGARKTFNQEKNTVSFPGGDAPVQYREKKSKGQERAPREIGGEISGKKK